MAGSDKTDATARDRQGPAHASFPVGNDSLRPDFVRLKDILDAMADGVYIVNQQYEIEYVNPAMEKEFGVVHGRKCHAYLRDRQEPCLCCTNEAPFAGKTTLREWFVPETGKSYDLFAAPLRNGDGSVSMLAIFHDITDRRNLERELSEVGIRQRQQIGQELHDRLGQQLLGVRLMAKSIQKSLQSRSLPEADTAGELLTALDEAQNEVRLLMRGVRPVEIDADGLMAALAALVESIEKLSGIRCAFRCDQPVPVENNHVATELFYIAQEAATNAVKHAKAAQIVIALEADEGQLRLWVRDDGAGCRQEAGQAAGMGLRIMRHRAALIGAAFELRPAPGGGTLVACTLTRRKE